MFRVIARNEISKQSHHNLIGLPRRYAPRNDEEDEPQRKTPRNDGIVPSNVIARNEISKQSHHNLIGLPRRFAPRNDGLPSIHRYCEA